MISSDYINPASLGSEYQENYWSESSKKNTLKRLSIFKFKMNYYEALKRMEEIKRQNES